MNKEQIEKQEQDYRMYKCAEKALYGVVYSLPLVIVIICGLPWFLSIILK